MGMEKEAGERMVAFKGYQVNDEIMALASKGCMVQALPAGPPGREKSPIRSSREHADEIFDEGRKTGLHAQKAIMYLLMGGK